MSLGSGTRIGAFEIVAAIGAGGMGEVYRARDSKLHRDVAIKVLPALFARDPERLARFEREARTLAALNHPHIAQVYGLVDLPAESGGHGLVLEFIDGEDLSRRIAQEPLTVEDALSIALQIAEALEAAHEQGIIHRDLKPANIKLRADGQAKVLDFGLAKALAGDADAPLSRLDDSPTITSPFQMSRLGVILGTAAYMAPEQAKGKPVDKRADIWAFGCVVFEMLTGTRPFAGEDITETLAAVVRADPNWSSLPPDTPPAVRTLLRRCLEKDRRERLPDIGAARLELKDVNRHASAQEPMPDRPVAHGRAILPWALFATVTVAAIVALAFALQPKPSPEVRLIKSVILPPSPLSGAPALRMQISPDGRRLVFAAPDASGRILLWVRPLDGFTAQPLVGTINASGPFWSPDSRRIGFIADGKLKTVDTSNGSVTTVCNAVSAPPGTWNADDVILFTLIGSGLARVPAAGGTPIPVTHLANGERVHLAPFFLPDGRHFLFSSGGIALGRAGVFVGSLDSPDIVRVLDLPTNTMYAEGHLFFLRETTLMTQPFDPVARALSGTPTPIAERIQINLPTGTGAFSVSSSGVLVYQTGTFAGTQLTWFDRTGKAIGTLGDPNGYSDVQLSPDGRFASATIAAGTDSAVWIFDVARNLSRRFTFGNGAAASAIWSPDGRTVVYAARRGGSFDIYRRPANGDGGEELLVHDDKDKLPLDMTAAEGTLLYRVPRAPAGGELWLLPQGIGSTPRPFKAGDASQVPAAVSPDGKWLAYVSDENTARQVYVTSFPDHVGEWQVSIDGGDNPRWRADGRRLFFMGDGGMKEAEVSASGTQFEIGTVRELFSVTVPAAPLATRSTYAVTGDGQRFLVNTWDSSAALAPITLVVNWTLGLQK